MPIIVINATTICVWIAGMDTITLFITIDLSPPKLRSCTPAQMEVGSVMRVIGASTSYPGQLVTTATRVVEQIYATDASMASGFTPCIQDADIV